MSKNVKLEQLRKRMAAKGIFSIAALSRRIERSRPTIYFAVENPKRYPEAYALIEKELA